jgi:hypothetical protein
VITFDAAWIAGAKAHNLQVDVDEFDNTGNFIGTGETLGVESVSTTNYQTYAFVWTPRNSGTTEVGFHFAPMQGVAGTTSLSLDNVQIMNETNFPPLWNGSFEYSPIGTQFTIGAGGGGAGTTFVGWRWFNVGSPAINGFTGTIVDAGNYKGGTPGSHAFRMDVDNTGKPAAFDYALDCDDAKVPVVIGKHYTLSFDLELDGVSGGTELCEVSIAEFDASGAFLGNVLGYTPTLPTDQTFHHYSVDYVPQHATTAKVNIAFRPRNPGYVAALVLDNVALFGPYIYATTPTNMTFSVSSGTLSLTWPGSYQGWIAQSNSVNLANTNDWFDIAGSASVTNLSIPISPATPNVFYRLRLP